MTLETTKPARRYLSPSDRYYLRKTTNFIDHAWKFFSEIEEDFRLLHMPITHVITR
jgi:hypothetical protein